MDAWLELGRQWLELARRWWALPETVSLRSFLIELGGISGGYWLASSMLGHLVVAIHDLLIEELAALLVVAYNTALALLYAMVMAVPLFLRGDGAFWRKAIGFLAFYTTLKGVYEDEDSDEIDEYSAWGYGIGLAAFFSFAVHPETLNNPIAQSFYRLSLAVSASWIGALATAYAAGRTLWATIHWVQRRFSWTPRLRDAAID